MYTLIDALLGEENAWLAPALAGAAYALKDYFAEKHVEEGD